MKVVVWINISSIKIYIRDRIRYIEKEKKYIENIYNRKTFLFIYDNITNINPNAYHESEIL